MSTRITSVLFDLFSRIFPAIEPLTPRLFSLFLTRYLRRWKANGSILSYKSRVKRLGKQHYLAAVDIEVTRKQTELALKRLLEEATGRR